MVTLDSEGRPATISCYMSQRILGGETLEMDVIFTFYDYDTTVIDL